ncbi:peptide ABC transporter [Oceanicola sp. 22II-s10i]|uniref:ABC transporter permease n=1 Tax=Oceanicola sp. 22II-s10i TaxID=1317116 RepID=UPI000B73BFC4|nr:ABC transporter permease [Oceanicola sp. 22II-s10i]OWU83500.1 peptide ABC transporter [Oceanicola sp. 22II-s10i]
MVISKTSQRMITRRMLQFVPVVFCVAFIAFIMLSLAPGDPAELLAGEFPTEERIQEIREYYGFDRPILVQFADWFGSALTGDLSESLLSREPVMDIIISRFPYTLLMVTYAMVIATVIGIPLGIAAAAKPGTWIDTVASGISSFGVAVPYFWVGMVLVAVFALHWSVFPATGMPDPTEDLGGALYAATLPSIALAMSGIAEITRQMRAGMIEVLTSQYVRTLRAKGLSPNKVLFRHGLRNVGITVITVITLVFNRKIGATVVLETVFAIPGIGSTMVHSAVNKDYVVVQGIILVMAMVVITVNLIADILYAIIDPRVEVET